MDTTHWTSRRAARVACLAILAALLLPAQATAQYFGRNKVQYQTFDFRILETGHFDVHFYPAAEEAVRDAGRMAERWHDRLGRIFDHRFDAPKPIILYADHPDFQQTNVIDAVLGEATGGVTEGLRTRVVMPLTGIYAETDHVLGHELVHAFQFEIARGRGGAGLSATGRLPLWFVEGMAEYLSLGREDPHTAMWLRDALLNDDLPTVDALTREPRYFPYRFGHALLAYVGGRWGDQRVGELYREALRRGLGPAISSVLGMSGDSLSAEWHAAVERELRPHLQGRTLPADAGRRLLAPDIDAGSMNLAPAVSPDGRWVAFLSERDLFTIDLFLADAETGRVVRRLLSSTSDPHFDALSFVRSAGTWSPDGERLAVVVFREGRNELAIVDVSTGRRVRTLAVPDVGAMWDPAWSPDGRRIAFAGAMGGISDLYVYDLEANSVDRLTSDRHAVAQPAWSPDGGTLAFATDRGEGTDFDRLTYAPLRLALLDVSSRQVRVVEPFPGAKHVNPQFSPDGQSVYFLSDRDGVSDIYRLELASGRAFRITRLATGVTGLTPQATAFSVALRTGQVVFTAFDDGDYIGYALAPAEARGTAVSETPTVRAAAVLPPSAVRGEGVVAAYLEDPVTGLASAGTFTERDYDSRLSLDYIGVPGVGVSFDRFGTQVGGAVAAYFGDMMGDRLLGLEVMSTGEIRDVAGQAFYQNRRGRWNWLVGGARIPYVVGGTIGQRNVVVDGQPARIVEQRLERVTVNRALADARYPLDVNRRLEANLGYTRMTFGLQIDRHLLVGGRVVAVERERVPADEPLDLFSAAAAYVGDNSFFGFTSPVQGWRYRYEVEPNVGSINFANLLLDHRRYFFRRPITLAVRGLHFGRYGPDAETPRLQPLFLGFQTLMRGYALGSFEGQECPPGRDDCPAFDRLIGSRIGVANAELRVPLLGTAEFGLLEFPYLPTELALFFDGGVAWTGDESPELSFERDTTARVPVFSAGVSTRVNLLGYLLMEIYYAYPFQRPDKGGHFGFQIAPGW